MNILAYHGTSEKKARVILAAEFRINNDKTQLPGDLGRGVYTFIDRHDKNEAADTALNYVKNIKNRYPNPKVLKLTCDINEETILDFNDKDNEEIFLNFREENKENIKLEMDELEKNGSFKRGNIDGLVIELLLAKFELSPSVVIKDTYTWFKTELGDYKRSSFPNAREMCIRKLEIIKNKCII